MSTDKMYTITKEAQHLKGIVYAVRLKNKLLFSVKDKDEALLLIHQHKANKNPIL